MRKKKVISFSPGNMKICCSCGVESEIVIDQDELNKCDIDEMGVYASIDIDKFSIVSEHDECWLYCNKCGNTLHLFT